MKVKVTVVTATGQRIEYPALVKCTCQAIMDALDGRFGVCRVCARPA
ncbi:hypothetical protein PQR05_29655 [Paraburkholderia sediminicola]